MNPYRAKDLIHLKSLLAQRQTLALLAPEGMGKSSLLNDLTHSLTRHGMSARGGNRWRTISLRPKKDLYAEMARALAQPGLLVQEDQKTPPNLVPFLKDMLMTPDSKGLTHLFRQFPQLRKTNVLLVIDPLRDLRQFGDPVLQKHFIELLMQSANQRELPLYTIVSMRPSIFEAFDNTPLQANLLHNPYILYPLTQPDIKRIIRTELTQMQKDKGIRIRLDEALLEYLSKHMARAGNQLRRLDRELRFFHETLPLMPSPILLNLETYSKLRGMSADATTQALQTHQAQETFAKMNDEQKAWVALMFQALIQPGEGRKPPTARAVTYKKLQKIVGCDLETLERLMRPFRAARLNFLSPPLNVEIDGNTSVVLNDRPGTHDWPRIRKWAEEEAQKASIYQQLSARAQAHGEGNAELLSDQALEKATSWWKSEAPRPAWGSLYASNFKQIKDFLKESEAASK